MQFLGLLPTDWYPVQVQPDPALGAGEVVVTNDKGIGALGPEVDDQQGAVHDRRPPATTPTTTPAA